MPKYS